MENNKQQAILILGMHRSGTSALTRTLNLLGADLGDNLTKAGLDNPKGFWEPEAIIALHDEYLKQHGSRWDLPDHLLVKNEALITKKIKQYISTTFSNTSLFVLKDPRMCRFAKQWIESLQALQIETKVIIPIRNPYEVAESLSSRNHLPHEQSYMLWLRYFFEAEKQTRKLKRIFTTYDQLLENWEILATEISTTLDIQWPTAYENAQTTISQFIDKNQNKHKTNRNLDTINNPWISEAYRHVCDAINSNDESKMVAYNDNVYDEFNKACFAFLPWIKQLESRTSPLGIPSDPANFYIKSPLHFFLKHTKNTLGGMFQFLKNYYRIKKSGMFDAQYYKATYPSVTQSNQNLLLHFLINGWRRGYNPNPSFDTKEYLAKHPNININPLLHYLHEKKNETVQVKET